MHSDGHGGGHNGGHNDPPDDDRPHLRLADAEMEADALLATAIDVWRDGVEEGDEPSDGFVDRVMQAEAARSRPRAVDIPVATPAVARRSRASSVWGLGLAAASVVALVAVGAQSLAPAQPDVALSPSQSAQMAATSTPAPAVAAAALDKPELAAEGTPGQPMPNDLGRNIEDYIAQYGQNYGPAFKFHGVVLVARKGEVLYERGFGYADHEEGTPNSPRTRYRLGLLTEPFTATAILQLRDAGLLELDDTLDRFLPEFPRARRITVRHLLTHRSGIPNYTHEPFFHAWKAEPHSTDAMLARLAKFRPEFAPGRATSPSNSNYFVLGAIIERVVGMSYGEYMATHVFGPSGMKQSTFGDAWETGEQAMGNVWNEEETLEPPAPIDMSTFGAAGGLVSSPADIVVWDRALRAGSLLKAESVREMGTPTEDGYGFGWLVTRAYGQRLLSFPGAIDGYSGSVLRFEEDGTLVVVLANTEVVPGAQVAQDVAMLVYGESPPERLEPAEVSIAPGTYYKYVGTYGISAQTRDAYADVVASERFDLLETIHVEQDGARLYFNVPGHARTWMHPMGRNRFFFKDHSGNKVSFELGEDKRSVGMVVHYQGAQFLLDRKAEP